MPRSTSNIHPNTKVEQQVATAFTEAQRTFATHSHCTKLLLSAFTAHPKQFLSAFTHALNRVLLIFSREPAVERLIVFISHFAANHTTSTGNFCSLVLSYLVAQSNVNSRAVRFRAIHLIAETLTALPENAEIDDDVWVSLQAASIQRAYDRIPRIRAASAAALCRLQTTGVVGEEESEDKVAKLLTDMLAKDSSAAVRKAAIQAVALTDSTLSHVATRTKDINPGVRKITYETLASKLHPSALHIDERVELLKTGLADRSEIVRNSCRDNLLLSGWFDGACHGNIFDLVELLGSKEYEDDVLQALNVIFKSDRYETLAEAVEIDVNNLTHADILIMRSMSDTKRLENCIEKFIPSTSAYAEVLRYYAVDSFAAKHLLELCTSVDMTDEVGRKSIEEIIRREFLANRQISEDIIISAVRVAIKAVLDEHQASRLLLEIVRDDILRSEYQDQDIRSRGEGSDEENDIRHVDEDYKRWSEIRALNICEKLLQISPQTQSSASASNTLHLNLLELAVLPHIMSEDAEKRLKALQCIGLYCLLDRSGCEAKRNMPLFIQACKNDIPEIQELGLKIIVDFLMVFDFSGLNPETAEQSREASTDNSDTSNNETDDSNVHDNHVPENMKEHLALLSESITHSDGAVRTVAAQGLARLCFAWRIAPSPILLSRLLIVHHNPSTEDDNLLRQCLSVFFHAFAMRSPRNRIFLEEAFLPTCRILMEAPSSSPLSRISALHVAQLIMHLTNPSTAPKMFAEQERNVEKSANLIHERLAEVVLNEILEASSESEHEVSRAYGKILSGFRFNSNEDNQDELELLRKLASAAIEAITDDKRLINVLNKFISRISPIEITD